MIIKYILVDKKLKYLSFYVDITFCGALKFLYANTTLSIQKNYCPKNITANQAVPIESPYHYKVNTLVKAELSHLGFIAGHQARLYVIF